MGADLFLMREMMIPHKLRRRNVAICEAKKLIAERIKSDSINEDEKKFLETIVELFDFSDEEL